VAKDRSLVRASDLGSWAYCNRAWWLAQVKGAAHEDPALLERGDAAHHAHGRMALNAGRLALIGVALGLAGLAILALSLMWQLMG
jgi:hypothetical protein